MSRTSKTTEEPKQTLPVGHPRAGYLPPAPAEGLGTGKLPDEEQERLDKAAADYETQAETITEAEDKAVKDEREAQEKEAERIRKWKEEHPDPLNPPPPPPADEDAPTTTTTSKSTSTST